MKNGEGTYYWSDGVVFSGVYQDDKKLFGRLSFPKDHRGIETSRFKGKGIFLDDRYIVTGYYLNNNFEFVCDSVSACEAMKIKRESMYFAKDFDGVDTWIQLFHKAANDPADFARVIGRLTVSANGVNAQAAGLVGGAARNQFQKMLTDIRLYSAYHPSPKSLLEKAKQCTGQREFTAAEACDCAAGFPGDSGIGPGAGELVVQSNEKLVLKACTAAAAAETNPVQKGRFLAQAARAQILTMNQRKAGEWIREAEGLGYKRAIIVLASANVISIEVRSGGIPPMTKTDFEETLQRTADYLRASQRAGIIETPIVAEQFKQVADRMKFNSTVLNAFLPKTPANVGGGACRLSYGQGAANVGTMVNGVCQ